MAAINSKNAFDRATKALADFGITPEDMKDDAKSSFVSREMASEVLGKPYSTDKGAENAWNSFVKEYRDFQAGQEKAERIRASKSKAALEVVTNTFTPAELKAKEEQAKAASAADQVMREKVKPVILSAYQTASDIRDKSHAVWCDLATATIEWAKLAKAAGQLGGDEESLSNFRARMYSEMDYKPRLSRDDAKNKTKARKFAFEVKNVPFENAVTFAGMVSLIHIHPNGIQFDLRKQDNGHTYIFAKANQLEPMVQDEASKQMVPNPNSVNVRVMAREIAPLYKRVVLGQTGTEGEDAGGSVPSDAKIALAISKRLPDLAKESPLKGFKPEDTAAIINGLADLPLSLKARVLNRKPSDLLNITQRVFSQRAMEELSFMNPPHAELPLVQDAINALTNYARMIQRKIDNVDVAGVQHDEVPLDENVEPVKGKKSKAA